MKVSKIIVPLIIIFFLSYGGYAFYKSRKENQKEKENEKQKLEKTFSGLCEKGQWINFSSQKPSKNEESYKEKLELKLEHSKFSDSQKEYFFVTDEEHSLDYFSGKEVEISGFITGKKKGKEITVEKIRCVGAEADKIKSAERQKLMKYLSANINKLVPGLGTSDKFMTTAFSFVNKNEEDETVDFYVEIESLSLPKDDSNYKNRIWLIRLSKLERPKPLIQELAFIEKKLENFGKEKTAKKEKTIEEKEIPFEKNILRGKDIYQDSKQSSTYNYDKIKKQWVLQ